MSLGPQATADMLLSGCSRWRLSETLLTSDEDSLTALLLVRTQHVRMLRYYHDL